MNRRVFSSWLGLLIMVSHVAMAALFLLVIELPDGSKVQEINLPITAAYFSSILAWFFAQQGEDTRTLNYFTVAAVLLVVFAFLAGMFLVPLKLASEDVTQMNERFLQVEFFFGAAFGLVMTELFGYQRE